MKRLDILKGKGLLDNISIETTSHCTNECYMCPSRNRTIKRGNMNDVVFKKAINELAEHNYSGLLHLYAQGEPFLDKKIFDRIEYTREKLPKASIRLISNFVVLDDDLIKKILTMPLSSLVVSVYALDEKTYENICGKNHFKKVITNLIKFSKEWAKTQPFMFSVFLIDSERNKHDSDFIQYFLEKLPCSEVARMPVYRIRGINQRERKPQFFCLNIFSTLKIDVNGDMSPCIIDVNNDVSIGNVSTDSIYESYNSEKAKQIRKDLFNNKYKGYCDICDFAEEHKLFYFLLPLPSVARSTLYSVLDIQPIKGYKRKKRVYNTSKMISEKAKRFDVLFNETDIIETINGLRKEYKLY